MQIRQIIDDFTLEKSLSIIDNDLLASVDDLHKAEFEVCDSGIERDVIVNPALEVFNSIRLIPPYVLLRTQVCKKELLVKQGGLFGHTRTSSLPPLFFLCIAHKTQQIAPPRNCGSATAPILPFSVIVLRRALSAVKVSPECP